MANYPEITYRFPTLNSDPQTSLRPSIILDWSADMETTQFSASAMLAKNIVLMADDTSTVIPLNYVSYTTSQRRLEVQAASSLSRGVTYRVIVKSKLASTDGRKSFNEYNWTFTTASGSLSKVTLLSPGDATVQAIWPALQWQSITALGSAGSALSVNYTLQIDDRWDFGSLGYSTTTTATSVVTLPLADQTTYYWRIQPSTTEATGEFSDVYSFFYGRNIDSDPSSRQTLPDADDFGVAKLSFKSGISHQSSHPTIALTFTAIPASTFSSFITIRSKSVLPRNDDIDSYDETIVTGSWTLAGSTITFSPASTISQNTRYEIIIDPDMVSTNGYRLDEEYSFYWTGRYAPFYISPRVIRSKFLGAEQQIPDDLINFFIYQASLEAKARYWGYSVFQAVGDSLLESIVRDSSDLTSFGVLKWTEAAAAYKILKAILFENLRDIGRTQRIGDSTVSLTADFVKGIDAALKTVAEDLDQWENMLAPSDTPLTVSRSSGWSPHSWDYDWSVRELESHRDDGFGDRGRWRY